MPIIKTGYSCPLCKRETGDTNEIYAEDRRLVCSKISTHTFNDSEEFMNMRPTIDFRQAPPAAAPQENHTSLTVSISVPLYNDLLAKYGSEKISSALVGALKIIVDGEQMVISASDLEELKRVLPEKPKNASHLRGMIFALDQQRMEAKNVAEQAAETVKGYEGMAPGKVLVDLGEYFKFALDHAKEENMPVGYWVTKILKNGFENNWF